MDTTEARIPVGTWREFFAAYLNRALYTTVPARRAGGEGDEIAPLSAPDYEAAVSTLRPLRSGKH